jgi:GMP synthase (glutamine-hydrolysing)
MGKIWIIKLGGTWPDLAARAGDFEDWTAAGLGIGDARLAVARIRQGDALPDPRAPAGVVLTGAHEMVTDRADWSVATGRWLADVLAARTPVLGICYGHQLLAATAGGTVGPNPRGREYGTARIDLTAAARSDPLFAALPDAFDAQVCHAQSALTVPRGATVLAGNAHDPLHAFRLGPRAWGVQFHPEFSHETAAAYVHHYRRELAAEGLDVAKILETVSPSPEAHGLLGRFADLVL